MDKWVSLLGSNSIARRESYLSSSYFSQSIFQQGRMQLSSLLLPGVFATGLAQQNLSDPQAACERLGSSFNEPHVTVNLAQYVAAGTNITLPEQGTGAASCGNTAQVVSVDLCRIAANVATSNRSEITMEAWLPTNW